MIDEELLRKWRRSRDHVESLLGMDAPDCLKAHFVVRVLIPQLAQIAGVAAFSAEIAGKLCETLCVHSGKCRWCHDEDSVPNDELCVACLAKYEAFYAEVMKGGESE